MRLSDIAEVRIGHNFRRELISLEKKEIIMYNCFMKGDISYDTRYF